MANAMLGEIRALAFEQLPKEMTEEGWMSADGQSLVRKDYPALFKLIGTTWGSTDPATFNIPDFRGFFLRGWDHGALRDPDTKSRKGKQATGDGDHVGTVQPGAFSKHTHGKGLIQFAVDGGSGRFCQQVAGNGLGPVDDASVAGGEESRPLNVYVHYVFLAGKKRQRP